MSLEHSVTIPVVGRDRANLLNAASHPRGSYNEFHLKYITLAHTHLDNLLKYLFFVKPVTEHAENFSTIPPNQSTRLIFR